MQQNVQVVKQSIRYSKSYKTFKLTNIKKKYCKNAWKTRLRQFKYNLSKKFLRKVYQSLELSSIKQVNLYQVNNNYFWTSFSKCRTLTNLKTFTLIF